MADPRLGVSILATPTLRSNKIAESAELLGMLSEVELARASRFASSNLDIQSKNCQAENSKRGFQSKPLKPPESATVRSVVGNYQALKFTKWLYL